MSFSMAEAEGRFPTMQKKAVRSSIYRLIEKGRIYSAWRGFYVIVPDEHALKGFVPPIEYIDSLMAYTGHRYYVGLLSAAAIYGAGHQQPQVLTVVNDSNDLRGKSDKSILFLAKASLPESYLLEQNAGYGKVMLSSPELTALDLIRYESRIGGLNRAAEIIGDLNVDFKKPGDALLRMFKTPIIQRLGFILENVLGLEKVGAGIYTLSQAAGLHFRKILLDPMSKPSDAKFPENDRWKVIINCELEVEM